MGFYQLRSNNVVKRGHTEGIEREKTSSQKSHGIALDFWIRFSLSNLRAEYNWRAIPAEYTWPHILISVPVKSKCKMPSDFWWKNRVLSLWAITFDLFF